MFIATLVLMAASAAGDDQGIVAKGSLVVGSGVLSALVTWLAAKKHAEKTQIPQPCTVEQSSYQAAMKANAKDHENLFLRMSSVEKDVAGIKADNAAQNRLLDRMVNRIDALYDRIILGGKKK
jgi:hypothetical protein